MYIIIYSSGVITKTEELPIMDREGCLHSEPVEEIINTDTMETFCKDNNWTEIQDDR